ncbi:MAG TPA: error-prone DNA polymerase [Thermoanaerobaculaceae bacterium]|nr:error-prone DNA polymerase [Thermoanaerobaculaceae bacterium]
MTERYCELHAHTAFSFLEGASEPEAMAERAGRLGLPAVAVTDRGGVYGVPRFHTAARDAGVEAIVGAEAVLPDGSRLPLLVQDARGYSNLCRMLTSGALGRPKGEAVVSWELLERHAGGLFALTGGESGPLVRALRQRGEDAAAEVLGTLVGIFGTARVAVEVQRHQRRGEETRNVALVRLARAAGVPVVATQDALCASSADGPLADALACIREHRTLDTAGRLLEPNRARHLRSPTEMARLFADLPEVVAATRRIADACPFRLHQLPYRFPSARLEDDRSEVEELRARVEEGARERYFTVTPKVRLQLERELSLIEKLGLAGYFLVVHDIVRFCRSRGILAQGRGSAANSAVCYALSITAVDPIAMELLFERFLSEERGEWPDIDIDLPSGDLREEVIQHVYRTYGERGAAMTANVITYKRRSAIREVGKVLGFSPEHLDRLSALSGSWEFAAHVREELPEHLKIAGLAPEERRSKLLVELVARIMHLPRHLGQHSGGMVLAAGRLDDVVPLEPASMPGRVVIQWDKDDCADLGIIKVDLLGLGMLQVLQDVVPLIREHEGVAIDLAHLPPDDPEVYGMLCRADTVGVFQIESRAQMATLPRMQPQRFYDLVVEVAIIRPGPIVGRMVHPYLNRRAGRERVAYPHPDLEPILKRTLGVPLFQEQLMRVAMVAAGFSGGQAEELRRAMGAKRSVERMAKLERQLREGMAERGIVGKAADDIVQGITSFALYGFPESHAASFALIAYASAYLRAHHPVCFLAALLNAWPMGFYHPATLVQDAKRHGVRVLPIDVNHSAWTCTIERVQGEKGRGKRGEGRERTPRDEARLVVGCREEGVADGSGERLSRPRDLAEGDGTGPCDLSAGQEAAARGNSWFVVADPACGGEHPGEHRRRALEETQAGIPSVPVDRARQLGGIAHVAGDHPASRFLAGGGSDPADAAGRRSSPPDSRPHGSSAGQCADRNRLNPAVPSLSPLPSPLSPGGRDGGLAIRLGLRFVKGPREEAVRRIEEEAARAPFASVREVAARCSLRNDELAALAEIGAFASLGQTRRSALWQVSALDGRRPPLAQAMQPDPPPSPLPEMTLRERYVADYLGSGVTVGKHPLALRRTELAGRGILSAAQLARVRDGQLVRVAGVVIVRQRPYTAKGMCFMTLEDETGFANIAVMPNNFELQRAVITSSALLEVEGRAQARDGVVTVLAGRCYPLLASTPASPSRDFH